MAVDSLATARLAMDVKSLDGLKRAAHRDPQAQLKKAAREFESLFLSHMLKNMRKAGFQSDLTDNRQVKFYQSMLDQQLAQKMAGKGMGISQMLVRQLSRNADSAPEHAQGDAMATRIAAIARGTPRSLNGVPSVEAGDQLSVARDAKHASAASNARKAISQIGAGTHLGGVAGHFIDQFEDVARSAAKISGVSPLLILAQAALETGWGRSTAAAADGSSSHNLFGIKAGSGWSGTTARSQTHEYVDGQQVTVSQPFRVYASDVDAFVDHAKLIAGNPRYASVRNAGTPEQAAHALQASGYATDPHYADKLIAIMKQIGRAVGM